MKIRSFLSATALISSLTATPVLAAPSYDTPVADTTTTAAMESQCTTYLNQLNSMYAPRTFTDVAVENVQSLVDVAASPTSSVEIQGTRQPVGSQIGADASHATANLANGKSPNIFTTNAKAIYAGSTYQTTDTYATTIHWQYFCTPTETVVTPGSSHLETEGECASRIARDGVPNKEQAPGLYCQDLSNRLTVTEEGTSEDIVRYNLSKGFPWAGEGTVDQAGTATDTGNATSYAPYTDPSSAVQAVVCISPTKNPGTWRGANLYTGPCSKALYDTLNSGGTPSASLPSY